MPPPTLEQKLTQLQLLSGPETLAAWEARHPEARVPVRAVLDALVDRELARRTEHKVAARLKAAKFIQIQTADTFNFEYNAATRKLRGRYLNLLATDLHRPHTHGDYREHVIQTCQRMGNTGYETGAVGTKGVCGRIRNK